MRVRLFTLRYSATLGGFDPRPVEEHLRDKELLSFREHLFTAQETPHLLCVVCTRQAPVVSAAPGGKRARAESAPPPDRRPIPPGPPPGEAPRRRRRREAPDPAADLDEAGRALYATLREWRAERALRDGVPPYLVFTNRELAEICRRRPDSPTALGHIHGIGPGKVRRHGGALLEILARGTGRAGARGGAGPVVEGDPPADPAGADRPGGKGGESGAEPATDEGRTRVEDEPHREGRAAGEGSAEASRGARSPGTEEAVAEAAP